MFSFIYLIITKYFNNIFSIFENGRGVGKPCNSILLFKDCSDKKRTNLNANGDSPSKRDGTKYIREKFSAIASLRILVPSLFTSSLGRKCTVKEVNMLSTHFSFQANIDGRKVNKCVLKNSSFILFCETRIKIVL